VTEQFALVLFAAFMKWCGESNSRDPVEPGLGARVARQWLARWRACNIWQPTLSFRSGS